MDKFVQFKRIIIKDMPEFNKICMQFKFKIQKNGKESNALIFAKQDRIMELNFDTVQCKDVYIYEIPLTRQPEFFLMNDDQTVSIIASMDDGIFYNMRTKQFVDLDQLFGISNIKEIIHDDEDRSFYLLVNKYKEKLGLFLIKFNEHNPSESTFFFKWKNKLDISDADIAVVRNKDSHYKELLVSYKTIYVNTFNVMLVDISSEKMTTLYRHESFQLWES